jgi:hypothetical protein
MSNTKINKTPPNSPKLISFFSTLVVAPASPVIAPRRKRKRTAASEKMNANNWRRLPPNPPSRKTTLLYCN